MKLDVGGKELELTETGFLINLDEWNEAVAEALAGQDGLKLEQRHWDVLSYLRDEYINNHENQPNTRTMVKAMANLWGQKVDTKTLYDLFPGNPSKQAGRLAGLPESRRKGGY